MEDNPDDLNVLKGRLNDLLANDDTDFSAILAVANGIARLEPDVVRFTTDAAMVRRLGRELVAKQETALAELVKNAYDADATMCSVLIDDSDGGSMEIVDDGCGMTRDDIERGFMRLASDDKVKHPFSALYGRSRAGKKGIGRFATERLGRSLTIVTQTAGEDGAWRVTVDWDAFAQGMDIGHIRNSVVAGPKERPHGTRLLVTGLNDGWSNVELKRVYRYLSTLLQPFFAEAGQDSVAKDPGFEVKLSRSGNDVIPNQPVANVDSEIFSHAVAVITATIDGEGTATWSLSSNRLSASVDNQPIGSDRNSTAPLVHARDVALKAHYFIQSRDLLGHSTGFIKDQLSLHGGIRLYRNGYRVPPYGERDDDWLGLDYKNTNTYAPINSKVFLGFVALSDRTGSMFEETSSREGLIETEAFREVREVMSAVLEAAVRRIESIRGKGRKRPKSDAASGELAITETAAAIAEVEALLIRAPGAGAEPSDQERAKDAIARLQQSARISSDVVRERDDLLKEVNLLRILASMGLTIAEFTHDFSHLGETLAINVGGIRRAAVEDPERLEAELSRLEQQFGQVRAYTSHFGSMMNRNASRDLQAIDLYDFARVFRENLGAMFERRGLALVVERPGEYDIYTIKMHPSEWSSILLNLLTNAIKAAARSARPGRFLIRVGTVGAEAVFLEFCDDGDGIPAENREHVFDAFFTTTGGSAARASESVQALGTGLGLKIVSDIVHSAGGTASVVEPPLGYATCIRIEVPAGEPDENETAE